MFVALKAIIKHIYLKTTFLLFQKFKEKQIIIISSRPVQGKPAETTVADDAAEGDADTTTEATTYPDVSTYGKAREILTGEPYNLGKTSNKLKNAEAILATAAELGVSFPNLQLPD